MCIRDRFKGYPWQKLLNKEIDPPFLPNMRGDSFEYRQQFSDDEQEDIEVLRQNAIMLRRKSIQGLFKGYTYEMPPPPPTPSPLIKKTEKVIVPTKSTMMSTNSSSMSFHSRTASRK
eukprot:TRINITY_DN427_c0_g1_i2.p3 TRINITY_DN427_c0_g1~~TRINITY_DN427_c0_g1_i2.p3  ORF type:complete len:117 (-),score=29.25 TRINITY_DN427_c0_g1_i2:581-931(-)